MAPLVSIVLPTHNGARFLSQSIQSVVDQTFRDWELIVVDDASTDDTAAYLTSLTDPRIVTHIAAHNLDVQTFERPRVGSCASQHADSLTALEQQSDNIVAY